jgi:predicted ester cyclase
MPQFLLLPLTALILIAMAIAMLASSVLLPMPDAAEVSVLGGTEVVQRFYAAVNETIATGNPAALQRVVTPSFVEENPLPGVDPGRAGLEDYLIALHDSVPGLRLVADVIVISADQVMTRVQVRHEPTSATLPAAFGERRAVWSPIEVFRVADGVVVGRWGHTDGLTLARPLAEETLELPIPTPRVITLERVTLAPGARWDAPRVGPRLLFLEEGALDVQAVPGSTGEGTLGVGSHTIASDGGRADATQRVLAAGKTWLAFAGGTRARRMSVAPRPSCWW